MYPLQFDTESLFYDFIFPIYVTLSNETAQILYLFYFPMIVTFVSVNI